MLDFLSQCKSLHKKPDFECRYGVKFVSSQQFGGKVGFVGVHSTPTNPPPPFFEKILKFLISNCLIYLWNL